MYYICNIPKTPHMYYRCSTTGHVELSSISYVFFTLFDQKALKLHTQQVPPEDLCP